MGFAKHAFEELGDARSPLLRRLSASSSHSQKSIRSCAPTRAFSNCRNNSYQPKTASLMRGSFTTMRS